jgi:hypothetical protein
MTFNLKGKVVLGTSFIGKRGRGLQDDGFIGLPLEGEPDTQTVDAISCDGIITLLQVATIKACRFSPPVTDAMDGVAAVDGLGKGIHL